jgi:hypothetical protein
MGLFDFHSADVAPHLALLAAVHTRECPTQPFACSGHITGRAAC